MKLARGRVLDGKSFREAATDAGYSMNTANRGEKAMRRQTRSIEVAFRTAAQEAEYEGKVLKSMIVHRLVTDVCSGRDSGVTRQAELIGRLKEVDAFVRNTDVQIGIFAGLADDPRAAESVEALSAELPEQTEK